MGYELQLTAIYTTTLLVLAAAWIGGYLDSAQHAAQDFVLGKMGENRASFGIKSAVSGQRVTGNEEVNKKQDELGAAAGGAVGKGGVGEGVGGGLSKGL